MLIPLNELREFYLGISELNEAREPNNEVIMMLRAPGFEPII